MSIKRIVVGTDLSARSSGAVQYAAELARTCDAVLHVVTACPAAVVTGAGLEIVAAPTQAETLEAIETELAAVAGGIRRSGVEVEIHACTGQAADMLCKVAETVDADLIVVGNRRMQGAGRVLGSVPNRVAHHAPCSVLIAKTG